jgi:hypothetical protein
MKIPWIIAVLLWWSFIWRLLVFVIPCSIVIGFLAAPVSNTVGTPGRDHIYALLGIALLWFPLSIVAVRNALCCHADLLTPAASRVPWSKALLVMVGLSVASLSLQSLDWRFACNRRFAFSDPATRTSWGLNNGCLPNHQSTGRNFRATGISIENIRHRSSHS